MHSKLLRYIQQQDDKRVYLESLQVHTLILTYSTTTVPKFSDKLKITLKLILKIPLK